MKTVEVTETEKKFFKEFEMEEPVIKVWYYDGYYEDYSWNSTYKDCSSILKRNNYTLEELNQKIQKAKEKAKKEKSKEYDYFTDSIDTDHGRITKACYQYSEINYKVLLELILLIATRYIAGITLMLEPNSNLEDLKDEVLNHFIKNKDKFSKEEVQEIFKAEERGRGW